MYKEDLLSLNCNLCSLTMPYFSFPRLLARPLMKPNKLYGIEYKQTLFGVHVPRKAPQTEVTDTWLLTFSNSDDAETFADELESIKEQEGGWPERVLANRPKKTPAYRPDTHKRSRKHEDKRELRITEMSEKTLVRYCALTGMYLRVGKKAKEGGFVFNAHSCGLMSMVSRHEITKHLEKLLPDD